LCKLSVIFFLVFLCIGFSAKANPGPQTPANGATSAASSPEQGQPANQSQNKDQGQNQSKDQSAPAGQAPAGSSPTPATPSQTPAPASPPAPGAQGADVKSVLPTTTYQSGTVVEVHTRLVMIDVIATDDHGHAVTDLQAKDFNLFEDGKPQKVRAFGFQHPTPPDPALKLPVLPPNVFTNLPLFPPSSAMNVILLDVLNTSLTDQAYARQKLLHYLDNMPANEPTAVYIMGNELRMVHDFTTDHAALKEAVEKTSLESTLLAESPEDDLPSSASLAGGGAPGAGNAQREVEQTPRRMRIDKSLLALQAVAHALAGFEGRKNLIWISAAFPLTINPNISLEDDAEVNFDEFENHGQKVAKTAQILTDSQVAIYPIDPRGLATFSTFSAANRGPSGRNPAAFGNSLRRDSNRLSAAHDTMNLLAENTGGKAYYNRNDIDKAIYDGVTDGSTYYLLGYYPDNKTWDGKFRKIQIKVERGGVKLCYRLGYYAADPQPAEIKPNLKQRDRDLGEALRLGAPISTSLFFEVAVMPSSPKDQNKVTISYAVSPHSLQIKRGDDGLEHADLECVVQVYNEKGKPVNSALSTAQAAMKPETYQKVLKSGFPCQNQLELQPGSYQLRFAVRDAHTGLIGTSDGKVTVSAVAAEAKPAETWKTP